MRAFPHPSLHPDYDALYKMHMKLSDSALVNELTARFQQVPLQKADRPGMLTDLVARGLMTYKVKENTVMEGLLVEGGVMEGRFIECEDIALMKGWSTEGQFMEDHSTEDEPTEDVSAEGESEERQYMGDEWTEGAFKEDDST
jgi:hypothetical protein